MSTSEQDQQIQAQSLDQAVEQAMKEYGVPGMAVGIMRDGTIDSRGYGVASIETNQGVTADTLFQIGSISKVFTTTCVMTFVEEGKLDLDKPVVTYLPDLKLGDEEAQRTITLRHLLTHTSGLEGDRFNDYGLGDDALTKAIAEFNTLRQITRPGELWTYCNSGFYLAGRVIEAVAEKPYEQVMRERIFEPLGLEHAFFFAHEAIVYPVAVGHNPVKPGSDEIEIARHYNLPRCVNAAGGIISNVGDLLKFAHFHMGDGTVGDKRVLSHKSLEEMQTPQTEAANFAEHYGLGWALATEDGTKVVSHGGSTNGFQAELALVPSKNFAIAMLTNSGRGGSANRDVLNWALGHYCELEHAEPQPIELPTDQLAWFAGVYKQPHSTLTLSVEDGGLTGELVSKSPLEEGKEEKLPGIKAKPISQRELIVTEGELKGMKADVIPDAEGKPRFIRFGGRLADYQGKA